MTEQEFHAARRMFFAAGGSLLLAPPKLDQTHREWLQDLFGFRKDVIEFWMESVTRGYVLGDRLVTYVGLDFSHRVDHHGVLTALGVFQKLTGDGIKTVAFGAKAGPVQPWPAVAEYDVLDYLSRADHLHKFE